MNGRFVRAHTAAPLLALMLCCGDIDPQLGQGAAACADGIDNDDDGLMDYPFDPGCMTSGDPAEDNVRASTACSDGLDNDGDGMADFGLAASADPGCQSAADDDETNIALPQCGDFVDNDGDGAIDTQDADCENANDASERPACSDGLDNDLDGAIDLADAQCGSIADADEGR